MSKRKLFGNNIEINCSYCQHSKIQNGCQFCVVNKTLKNGKCRKFIYNPIMRVPKQAVKLQKYYEEDFLL